MSTRVSPGTLGGRRPLPVDCGSNVRLADGDRVGLVRVDKGEELALYDDLPPRWRRLVDSAPLAQRMSTVVEYLRVFGDGPGYDRIVATWRGLFPGWRPPEETDGRFAAAVEAPRLARRRRARGEVVVPTYGEGEG